MSIGDVLKSLREEFPEITVSKIRFLEAEGLIEPERTPSGYRKFYQQDLARLRYILRLQRDNFMPLKVIRRKLEQFEADGAAPARPGSTAPAAREAVAEADPALPALSPEDDLEAPVGGLHLSFDELATASGLSAEHLRELEEYGLVRAHPLEGTVYFDEDDLLVAKIARDFGKYGIEPRHMRMYRHFADREAGLFEQAVVPHRASSNDSRRRAVQSLSELAKLSKRLKHLLLRTSLRSTLPR
jgi:DNA-binding transcriptional MerR regulator